MKSNISNRQIGGSMTYGVYYCMNCGFARIFEKFNPQFNQCPACGNDTYVESYTTDKKDVFVKRRRSDRRD